MSRKIKISFINATVDKTIFRSMLYAPKQKINVDGRVDYDAWWLNASLLHFKTYYELYSPELSKNVEWHQVMPTRDHHNSYVEQVIANKSDWLFIGLYIWTTPGLTKIIKRIKEKLPNIKILVGGPEVEHKDFSWIKQRDWIDYACYGDGYKFVKYLLDCDFNLRRPRIEETENALWVENGEVVKAEHVIFKDKKFFSIPLWWHNRKIVREWFAQAKENNITIVVNFETNRGCPYHCAFCDWTSGLHNKVSFWSLIPLYKDLAFLAQENIKYIKVNDANYGQTSRDMDITKFWAKIRRKYQHALTPMEITWAKLQKERVYEIFDFMLKEGFTDGPENQNIITWTLSFQDVQKEVLDAINRPEIPWEEHKSYIQKLQNKYPDAQMVTELISGMPYQTPTSMLDTMKEVLSLNVRTRWYHWVYLPNSPVGNKKYRDSIGIKILNLRTPEQVLTRPPTENDLIDFPICWSYINGVQTAIDNFKITALLKNFYAMYHSKTLIKTYRTGEVEDNFIDLALTWFENPNNSEIWQIVAKKCEDIILGKTRDAYFYTSMYTVDLWNFIARTMSMNITAIPKNGIFPDATWEQKRDRLIKHVLQPVHIPDRLEVA